LNIVRFNIKIICIFSYVFTFSTVNISNDTFNSLSALLYILILYSLLLDL